MGNSTQKPKGWHSRRHETSDAQREARERYQHDYGRVARQRKAQERLAVKQQEHEAARATQKEAA